MKISAESYSFGWQVQESEGDGVKDWLKTLKMR